MLFSRFLLLFHRAQMHRPAVFARMTTIPESGIIAS
jgi:hypothetical protein